MEQVRKQQFTLQSLSRQNVSRNVCGAFPNASNKATRLPHVLKRVNGQRCRPNAITYLVHSTYFRNSTALLLKSLDLLFDNYLVIDNHHDKAGLLIFPFHTGDYSMEDYDYLDSRYNGVIHFKLIDLSNSEFWILPDV